MERRAFFTALGTGVGAGLGLLATNAAASKPVMGHFGGDSTEDDVAVANVVFSERWARDTGQFDLMTSFWNPNATVAVSWFKGPATAFIAATESNFAKGVISLHVMGGAAIIVNDERATADCSAQIVIKGAVKDFNTGNPVVCLLTTWVRINERLSKIKCKWGIDQFAAIYQTGTIVPYNPGDAVALDPVKLASFRPSYACESYILSALGVSVYDDLPGFDQPQTVADFYAANTAWLNGA